MAENQEKLTAQDLLNQIGEFEKTLANLGQNVSLLKQKIEDKRKQFGEDPGQWPQK
jgi:hypothetical protein